MKKNSLTSFASERINQLELEGRYSTAHIYSNALRSFTEFCGTNAVSFQQINRESLKLYYQFLLDHHKKLNTISTYMHDAIGKKVVYNSPYSQRYKANGDSTLTDGKRGDWSYGDGAWQGFIAHDKVDVTIDMEKTIDIHETSTVR